jgi:Leucine Rich repeat
MSIANSEQIPKHRNPMNKADSAPRATRPRRWVQLAAAIVLAPFILLARCSLERANIDALHEEARRLGGYAEIPEGGMDLPWGLQIQVILDLAGPAVDDEVFGRLQHMPGFKHVQILSLGGTRITDRSLKLLENDRWILSLNLSRTAVTDRGMESLTKLPSLSGLELSGTDVTDAGLDVLTRSRLDLRSIDLTGTRVTAEGLRRLTKAFPQIYIKPGAYRSP